MKLVKLSLFLISCFFFSSCIKDIDVDQFDEIVIPPSVEMDLVYFQLTPEDFLQPSGSRRTMTDELRLEFLDDDYIQTGLKSAEFNTVFINKFDQPLTTTFTFLSEGRTLQHRFTVDIPAGSEEEPTVINYTEIFPETQIEKIRRSIWLVTEVEILGEVPTTGQLTLESKALYKFEF